MKIFPRSAVYFLAVLLPLALRAQTVIWQETWESPAAQDAWYASNGVWEIGVPTSGPATNSFGWRAHGGTNCAATVLDGDYPTDRQSRLISPPLLVPIASLNPRLRFWHWWSFGMGDFGQVQISTNGGIDWEALSGKYGEDGVNNVYDSSERWSRAWLDLALYAGQTVQLGFYFESHTTPGVGPTVSSGWYVDELAIESGPEPGLILPESFESGWGGWKADYAGGLATDFAIWEIGPPSSGPGSAHGGTNCAATVLDGDYPTDRQSRLISPPLLVPIASLNPRLRFWHWWSFGMGDFGQVQISTNGGIDWEALSGKYGEDGVNNVYDSSERWSRAWLDLALYAGQTVQLGFYFESHTTPGVGPTVSSGWYVDELAIESGPEPGLILPESFENGWGGWKADYAGGLATDFAIWEIGPPSSGPGSAHGGTNCAATVLDGDYPTDRQSRLISPPLLVPIASLNPRLRFWHWWSFGMGDFGQVQISTNGGIDWEALSGKYGEDGVNNVYDSSERWSRAWLDLALYAGQTVQLGFYFESHTTPGVGPTVSSGWYVDELAIESGPEPGLILPESFESGWGGWKADYAGGLATDFAIWEIGPPSSGPGSAHGGTNCAATVLDGDYPTDRQSRLISPPLLVPIASLNPRLRFWHWWSFGMGDFGQVQISTNGGIDWEALSGKYGEDGVNNVYDSSERWSRAWLDLALYAGQTVQLGFYFESHTTPGVGPTVSSGWYVDELAIESGPEPGLILPESFESGWGGWKADYAGGLATDFAIWEIGPPSSGPGSAHGGTNCAATVLDGDYPTDRQSRLISPPLLVPIASLNPRLRFWHWWSFGMGDFGQVQISTNRGVSWEDLSPQYTTSSGDWTYSAPFSLSPYGGQTVQFGWYFESHTTPGVGPTVSSGWYVDGVVLLANGYPPMITAQPTNLTVVAGDAASFSVAVSPLSELPLRYQWRFNGIPILNATNSNYTIASAATNHASCCGQGYDVTITNLYGVATSVPPAELTVLVPPAITLQPQSQIVSVGSNVTFSVSATGTAPLYYQWRANGTNVQGAFDSTLMLPNVQLIQSGTAFSVLVSNVAGATNSATAYLTVLPGCGGFSSHDVGDVGSVGTFSRTNCEFTIRGSGEDMEGTADAFQFVHQPLIGDGQITAHVLGLQGGDSLAEAGVMFRESLESGSRHVLLAVNSRLEALFRRRLLTDTASVENTHAGTNYAWLRLMRTGNTFVGHVSTNGVNWEYAWFTTLNLPSQLEAGVAVTAHGNGLVTAGSFDEVFLGGLTPLPGIWPEPGPKIYLGGEPLGADGLESLGGFKMLIGGVVGDEFSVLASPDVTAPATSWSVLGKVTNRWGVVEFLDPRARIHPLYFYRAQRGGP